MSAVAPTRNLQVFASLPQLVIGVHEQCGTGEADLARIEAVHGQLRRKRRPLRHAGGAGFRAPVR
jgi:hypothetical protein